MNDGPVTFDSAPPPGTINFGVGQPSADLLPIDLLRTATAECLRKAQPHDLNYGASPGDERFLGSLARFLSGAYSAPVAADSLFLTGGNSQALDLVSTVFARPGDTVFVEEPSYFLAFQIFRDHGLKLIGIPMNEEGLDLDCLQQQLQKHQPAFLYTVPTFHNPTGRTLPQTRRLKLLELSHEHDFLIVADEVYHLLSYGNTPPPAFGTYCEHGKVVSLGSFSKILAPALRLGWIQTAGDLRQKLLGNGMVNSGGSVNHFTSHIVRQVLESGSLANHIEDLCDAYRRRLKAMDEALLEHFDSVAYWSTPSGGYFFWLTFDPSIDTALFRDAAREQQSGFQSGGVFSAAGGQQNGMRLSFSLYGEADITAGVARLKKSIPAAILAR